MAIFFLVFCDYLYRLFTFLFLVHILALVIIADFLSPS